MKIRRNIYIEKELWEKIRRIAKKEGRSICNYLESFVKSLEEK